METHQFRELGAIVTLSFLNFFVLQGFFLPILYILETLFFNKLTKEEVIFLLYTAQQESGRHLIGSLEKNRICIVLLNKK